MSILQAGSDPLQLPTLLLPLCLYPPDLPLGAVNPSFRSYTARHGHRGTDSDCELVGHERVDWYLPHNVTFSPSFSFAFNHLFPHEYVSLETLDHLAPDTSTTTDALPLLVPLWPRDLEGIRLLHCRCASSDKSPAMHALPPASTYLSTSLGVAWRRQRTLLRTVLPDINYIIDTTQPSSQ